MLLADFIKAASARLETLYPSPEARGIISLLCRERLGVESYTHLIEPGVEIPAGSWGQLDSDMERLAAAEPIQYVLGKAEFYGRTFRVTPAVLIPRPETGQLVEGALSCLRVMGERPRVVDLCTGSGCIAWSVALECPSAEVMAADISQEALEVAATQFDAAGAPSFVIMDVLDLEQPIDCGTFDLLLSNPPYIMEKEKPQMRRNVLDYEPPLALFVPDEDPLLFYRSLALWSQRLLKPGGVGIVEINETLSRETAVLFEAAGMQKIEILADFFKKPRFVKYQK